MNYFFDVGANIGQTFYWYLEKTNEFDKWGVFCFEPSPRNLTQLTLEAQKHTAKYNIVICPFGLGGDWEISKFYLKTDPAADSYSEKWLENEYSSLQVLSSKIDISWFIKTYTTENDNIVLKLDCEGSEYEILKSLLQNQDLLSRISKIMVEWHGQEKKKEELIESFKKINKSLEAWNL
jgi:FkbM family methyltransferase